MTKDDITTYESDFPDVIISGICPKKHWEIIGSKIGRKKKSLIASEVETLQAASKPSEHNTLVLDVNKSTNACISQNTPLVVLFVHLYYRDLWSEIEQYIKNIPLIFDLYITISNDQGPTELLKNKILESFPQASIHELPNQGLDCGPFLQIFRHALKKEKNYKYALKIHTKKSLGSDPTVGKWWRKKTYESLLGSSNIIINILKRLSDNELTGMVGPVHSRMSVSQNDLEKGCDVNQPHVERLATAYDIKDRSLDFFCGTMFWFRFDCLAGFLRKDCISINDFEAGYSVDGTLAHGVERILPCMVRDNGRSLYEQSIISDVLAHKYRKNSVCFIHPGFGIGGGNRVLFDLATEMSKYYNVFSASCMGSEFTHWMKTTHPVIYFSSEEEIENLLQTIDCNYVFATGWQTFNFVRKLPSKYKKLYFIQDYEPWFANSQDAVATYYNNFTGNFVIADWLQKKLKDEHGLSTTLVKLGVAKSNRINRSIERKKAQTILCYHKLRGHRGRGADLIEEFLSKIHGISGLDVRVIGHEPPNLPEVNFLGELLGDDLEALYEDTDILVDLSRHRGIATMAMEMSKYGTVPILSAPEYGLKEYGFECGKNAYFVNTPDEAVKRVMSIVNDDKKFSYMSNQACALSNNFNYEITVKNMIEKMEGIY